MSFLSNMQRAEFPSNISQNDDELDTLANDPGTMLANNSSSIVDDRQTTFSDKVKPVYAISPGQPVDLNDPNDLFSHVLNMTIQQNAGKALVDIGVSGRKGRTQFFILGHYFNDAAFHFFDQDRMKPTHWMIGVTGGHTLDFGPAKQVHHYQLALR